MTPDDLPARFASKVRADDSGCWLWSGYVTPRGYGTVGYKHERHLAHRLAYSLLVGPIPEGLTIDHLCMVKNCVNPAHLEPVTLAENVKRARRAGVGAGAVNVAKTHCPKGHPYDEENTCRRADGRRECRTCNRERVARLYTDQAAHLRRKAAS